MDNPALSGLLPPILRSKRDILFGNMPEIYNFHSRRVISDSHHRQTCLKTQSRCVNYAKASKHVDVGGRI